MIRTVSRRGVGSSSAGWSFPASQGSRGILTATLLATHARVVIAPAMNTGMWENPVTQENIAALKSRGVTVIEPVDGELACGVKGRGRMMDPEQIFRICSDKR